MAPKMIGVTILLVLLALAPSDGQVMPVPCCRLNCCDGRPGCCSPGLVAAMAPIIPAAANVAGPAAAGAASRKVFPGN
ncbi:hypothetical protein CFC21_019498 [Triticum aestivum]|uniref:Uncharacterized protein n=2 Tax=Triticum aestivum TaxID=4565 RepID=A0A3B6B6F9_WHEAT|nr:hypothetical protein CFC21_019498 [Triticum aestivum]